ncbi:MAG: hypothetical protein Q8P67_16055, partial [archaeon]|nr:hypothetical protein [archaeon]
MAHSCANEALAHTSSSAVIRVKSPAPDSINGRRLIAPKRNIAAASGGTSLHGITRCGRPTLFSSLNSSFPSTRNASHRRCLEKNSELLKYSRIPSASTSGS